MYVTGILACIVLIAGLVYIVWRDIGIKEGAGMSEQKLKCGLHDEPLFPCVQYGYLCMECKKLESENARLQEALKKIAEQEGDCEFHNIWNPDSGPEVSYCKAEEIAKSALEGEENES